jgi:DNA-binding GntR family transcriptional regulator
LPRTWGETCSMCPVHGTVPDVVLPEPERTMGLATLESAAPKDRVSVIDLTYEALRDLIVRGSLQPGVSVVENTLAQRLQVSRTPLRHAIERLETDGLMIRSPNGRLHISPVSTAEVFQLFAVRIALEDLAITEAIPRITDSSIEILGHYIEAMHHIDKIEGNVADAGVNFHNLLYLAGENKVNRQTLSQLQPRIDRYRFLSTQHSRPRQRNSIQEHRDIYDAVKIRDVERARETLKMHLTHARDAVLRTIP